MPSIIVDDKIVREKLSRDMFYTISDLLENTFYVYIDDNEIEKVVDKQIENSKKEVIGALRTITNL
jgi:hypothetical protein